MTKSPFYLAVLAAIAVFLSVVPVRAEIHEFGPQTQRFTLDVPAGWTQSKQKDGICLTSPDKKSAVAISIIHNEGEITRAAAKRIARVLNAQRLRHLDERTSAMATTQKSIRVLTTIRSFGDVFAITSFAGPTQEAEHIAESIHLKME